MELKNLVVPSSRSVDYRTILEALPAVWTEGAGKLVRNLITHYETEDDSWRSAVRELVFENEWFTWAAPKPIVNEHSTLEELRNALIWFSIEDQGHDPANGTRPEHSARYPREQLESQGLICELARKAEMDVRPHLLEIAAMSSDQKPDLQFPRQWPYSRQALTAAAGPDVPEGQRNKGVPSLQTLRRRFHKFCDQLEASASDRVFHTTLGEGAHIERIGRSYHYVVAERGHEFERRVTTDPDHILFWLISDIVTSMAQQTELKNRRPGEDTRRQWFAEGERLLRLLRDDWADEWCKKVDATLQQHPFNDQDEWE
jgi:hypothetical protein